MKINKSIYALFLIVTLFVVLFSIVPVSAKMPPADQFPTPTPTLTARPEIFRPQAESARVQKNKPTVTVEPTQPELPTLFPHTPEANPCQPFVDKKCAEDRRLQAQ